MGKVGFNAETSKTVVTPRGTVELDVYAIDPLSIDKITYVIECKNWDSNIPQTVIHAFTRVIQETGANIGYIISKKGFQSGAYDYTQFTNITIFTFEEFQSRYIRRWFEIHFCSVLDESSDSLIQYTEPINIRRERFVSQLDEKKQVEFEELKQRHLFLSGIILSLIIHSSKKGIVAFLQLDGIKEVLPIEEFKTLLTTHTGRAFTSTCYFDLLNELVVVIENVTSQFNDVFGQNIFLD